MPIRGIFLFLVLAAIIAWFYKEEICQWLKDPRRDDEEENNNENKEE